MGWFTFQTLKRITRNHPEHRFYFLFDRTPDPGFVFSDNVTPVTLFPQARHPVLWYLWFEYSTLRFLNKKQPDLFLSTDGYLSLNTKVPSLPVIHDINFHHLSQHLPFMARKYYRHYFPKFARKATRIATVSEYSKKDLVQSYKLPPEKIDVVFNGSDDTFQPLPEGVKTRVREKYTRGAEYFIFIGSLHPRKNVCRTLLAFDLFKKKTGLPHKLLMIGKPFFKLSGMKDVHANMEHKEDVIFFGRTEREIIKEVLAASTALLFVPLFEGFGIPMLEGFRCEIPVIAGDRTSLPEVGGDAALYVDPYSENAISEAMVQIVNEDALRRDLIKKGRARKDIFSWDKSAELLWNSIEKTLRYQ